jgi:hypothetical protein
MDYRVSQHGKKFGRQNSLQKRPICQLPLASNVRECLPMNRLALRGNIYRHVDLRPTRHHSLNTTVYYLKCVIFLNLLLNLTNLFALKLSRNTFCRDNV